jgi:hypothetical protein
MTTLLQQMAELPPNVTFATKNRWSRISFEVVRGRLNGFPVSVAHFEGGAALAVDPNDKSTLYAERFVFQDDVPSVVSGFEEQGALHWPEARKTLHHPAHIYWVEWKHKYEDNIVTIGVMVDTVLMRWRYPDSPVLMVFCASVSGGRAEPFCAMLTQDMPIEFPCWIKVPWLSLNGLDGQPETQEDLNEAQSLFYDFMYTLFMIVTPRVTEVVEVSHSPKLQKARAKSRKFPLLEYKKCQLQSGIPVCGIGRVPMLRGCRERPRPSTTSACTRLSATFERTRKGESNLASLGCRRIGAVTQSSASSCMSGQ